MDQSVLRQYAELKAEIKDLKTRIEKLEREIRQTEKDSSYDRKRNMLSTILCYLKQKEEELVEQTNKIYEYIDKIPSGEIRMMFRFYYIDDLNWNQVAHRMNQVFPKRCFTEDSCRMKNKRFFKKTE